MSDAFSRNLPSIPALGSFKASRRPCHPLPPGTHPELGNNAQLAQRLDLVATGTLRADGVGLVGHCREPTTGHAFARRLAERLGRDRCASATATRPSGASHGAPARRSR